MDQVDRAMGKGVVRYDTVVHVSPVTYCPATEPEPTKKGPDPAINRKADAGDVRVAVVDTGCLQRSSSSTPGSTASRATRRPPAKIGHYRGHGTFAAGVLRTMAPKAHVDIWAFSARRRRPGERARPRLVDVFLSNVDIISMSAGAAPAGGNSLLSLQAVYDNYLKGSKTLLVCAAGNDAAPGPFEPASQGWPVAVGALDTDGRQAGYSNYGAWVDVWARGSDVVNAYPKGVTSTWSPDGRAAGRQLQARPGELERRFATPLVAGLVAARMSTYGENAHQAWAALRRRCPSGGRQRRALGASARRRRLTDGRFEVDVDA